MGDVFLEDRCSKNMQNLREIGMISAVCNFVRRTRQSMSTVMELLFCVVMSRRSTRSGIPRVPFSWTMLYSSAAHPSIPLCLDMSRQSIRHVAPRVLLVGLCSIRQPHAPSFCCAFVYVDAAATSQSDNLVDRIKCFRKLFGSQVLQYEENG